MVMALEGELGDAERHALEQHRAACPDCGREWEELRALQGLLAERRPAAAPPAELHAWRERLADRLDEEPAPAGGALLLLPAAARRWWQRAGLATALPRVQVLPGMAVGLVFAGFLAGWALRGRGPHPEAGRVPGVNVAGLEDTGGTEEPMRVNAVNHDPRNGQVQIVYDTVARRSLAGDPNDPQVRDLLLYAVQNPPNSGVRLDSIAALRATTELAGRRGQSAATRAAESAVRQTLLWALSHDANPGVRLQALDALTPEAGLQAGVRQALLQAVLEDPNPGVRSAAINALAQVHEADVSRLLHEAEERSSDLYVKLRVAAVLRQMEAELPTPAADGVH